MGYSMQSVVLSVMFSAASVLSKNVPLESLSLLSFILTNDFGTVTCTHSIFELTDYSDSVHVSLH